MGVELNPVTVTWIGGIGLSAILASLLILREDTNKWSDRKIVASSMVTGFIITILLEIYFGLIIIP